MTIQKETKLFVGDNSDAKQVLCIHNNKKKNKIKNSSLGNFLKVTIKKKVSKRKNIKKKINWCLIGTTTKKITRLAGESLRFSKTKAILVDEKKKKTMGTLIKGVLPREIKSFGYTEIILKARRLV